MFLLLEDNRDAIEDLCQRYRAERLDVFGSALRDAFRPGVSDLDLPVEFGPMSPYERADANFRPLNELRSVVGADIDLVISGAGTNRIIPAEIESTKQAFCAA